MEPWRSESQLMTLGHCEYSSTRSCWYIILSLWNQIFHYNKNSAEFLIRMKISIVWSLITITTEEAFYTKNYRDFIPDYQTISSHLYKLCNLELKWYVYVGTISQHLLASVRNISDIGDYFVKMTVIFSDTCHQEIYSVGNAVLPLCGDFLISCFIIRKQQGWLFHNKFDQCYQMVRGQTKDILWGIVL